MICFQTALIDRNNDVQQTLDNRNSIETMLSSNSNNGSRTQNGSEFTCDFPHKTCVLCKKFNISLVSRVEKYWAASIILSVRIVCQITVGNGFSFI